MEGFGSSGYNGISLNDICKQACVPKGSMYYNFSSKK